MWYIGCILGLGVRILLVWFYSFTMDLPYVHLHTDVWTLLFLTYHLIGSSQRISKFPYIRNFSWKLIIGEKILNNSNVSHSSIGWKSETKVLCKVGSFWGLLGKILFQASALALDRHFLSMFLHIVFPLHVSRFQISPFYKHISHIWLGPTLMISFDLDYPYKEPVSK